jgi:hypothetical protein
VIDPCKKLCTEKLVMIAINPGLQIAVGDMVIPVADFKRMVSEGRKIIRYKDE